MWTKLRGCFDYAEVELSNNLAENSMRPVALGRKNWLHVGSAKSGPKVAAILSVVESCRRLDVPVKDYLLDVLPGLNAAVTTLGIHEAERLTLPLKPLSPVIVMVEVPLLPWATVRFDAEDVRPKSADGASPEGTSVIARTFTLELLGSVILVAFFAGRLD